MNLKKYKEIPMYVTMGVICAIIFIVLIINLIIQSIIYKIDFNKINDRINNYDWISTKEILDKYNDNDDSEFLNDAYAQIFSTLTDKVDNVKSGNSDEKLKNLLADIRKDISQKYNKRIEDIFKDYNTYSTFNSINEGIKQNGYIWAYSFLEKTIKNYSSDEELVNRLKEKNVEILNSTLDEVIKKAQEKIHEGKYKEAKKLLQSYTDYEYTIYKNEKTETISNLYKDVSDKVKKIEDEEAKQEAKEQAKKEAEEKARKEAELSAKKDKLIVNSDGKKIYQVYMSSNTFNITGKFTGKGHFSIQLLDSNQDLYKLLVNEIGDYFINKSVNVTKGKYYYIQIECTRGNWDLEWTGTYGQ